MEELLKKKEKDFRVLEAKLQRLEQSYLLAVKQNRSLQNDKKDVVMFLEDQGFVNPRDATLDIGAKLGHVRLWAQNMAADRKTLENVVHMIFPNDRMLWEMCSNSGLPIDFEEIRLCWIAYEELYSEGAAAVQSAARGSIITCERKVDEVEAEKAELEESLEEARLEIQKLNREKACLLVERLNEQTSSAHSTTSSYALNKHNANHGANHMQQLPRKLPQPPPPPTASTMIDASRAFNDRHSGQGMNNSVHVSQHQRPSPNVMRGMDTPTPSNRYINHMTTHRDSSYGHLMNGDSSDKQQVLGGSTVSSQPHSDDIGIFERNHRGTSSHSCGSNSVCGTDYPDPAAPPYCNALVPSTYLVPGISDISTAAVSPLYPNNQRIVPSIGAGGSTAAHAGRLLANGSADTLTGRQADADASVAYEALQTNSKLREVIHELKLEKERLLVEYQNSRSQAKEMLVAKDTMLEKLRNQVSSLQENDPTVQLLQKWAEMQASRELQLLEMNAKVNKMGVALQEADDSMVLERKQTKLLKDTVRELQGSANGQLMVNYDYLKNVVVQFMEFIAKGDAAADRLIPVICKVLLLDSKESERIQSYFNRQPGASLLLSFKAR